MLVTAVGIAHWRAGPSARSFSRNLAALFTVLIFFGVVIDAGHHLFLEYPVFDAPMTSLEDGGEIVTMSFVVSFLFAVAFAGHRPDARAWPSRQTRGRTNR